jgi:hypothetical protein
VLPAFFLLVMMLQVTLRSHSGSGQGNPTGKLTGKLSFSSGLIAGIEDLRRAVMEAQITHSDVGRTPARGGGGLGGLGCLAVTALPGCALDRLGSVR